MFILYYSYGKKYRFKNFDSYKSLLDFLKRNKNKFIDFSIFHQLILFDDNIISNMNSEVLSNYDNIKVIN